MTADEARAILQLTDPGTMTVDALTNQYKKLRKSSGSHETVLEKLPEAYVLLVKAIKQNSGLPFSSSYCDLLCGQCVSLASELATCNRCCKVADNKTGHSCGYFGGGLRLSSWPPDKFTRIFQQIAHGRDLDTAIFEFDAEQQRQQVRRRASLQVAAEASRRTAEASRRKRALERQKEVQRVHEQTRPEKRARLDSPATEGVLRAVDWLPSEDTFSFSSLLRELPLRNSYSVRKAHRNPEMT